MANISKIKRDRMLKYLESLKAIHNDDESIKMFNEIEDSLTEKKYGLVFEEHTEQVDEMLENNIPILTEDKERILIKDKTKPVNFIIEGDNLQALYLLEKTHRGKVDCIYIDPPYNTGARDWKYNNDYVDSKDTYRHSKWLSMMKRRLEIARTLLKSDTGVLICAIDDNELNTLGLLIEDLFPLKKVTPVTVVHNPSGTQGNNFSYNNEFLLFVYNSNIISIMPEDRDDENADIRPFMNGAKGNSGNYLRASGANTFYPIIVKDNKVIGFGNVCDNSYHPNRVEKVDDKYYIYPIDNDGVERKWLFARDSVDAITSELFIKTDKNGLPVVYRKKNRINHKTVWFNPEYNAKTYGTMLVKNVLNRDFPFPKSLYAVKEAIKSCVEFNKNAIILDFFAGSGTTLHAVNLLNAEDDGNRKCIIVTNNEVSEKEERALSSQGFKKGDSEWESLGIAHYITWPRVKCFITGNDINGRPIVGNYFKSNLAMAKGFNTNAKFLKCSWTPRKPDDHLLSNVLMMHIKEMIELQNFIEIDNEKNVLILNKDDVRKYLLDQNKFNNIEKIWINQNIVLNSTEIKLLNQKDFKYVPKEFFGDELKEAAE